jgi:hypothetical protein
MSYLQVNHEAVQTILPRNRMMSQGYYHLYLPNESNGLREKGRPEGLDEF